MTKQAFIHELETALAHIQKETREEIISDISEHFSEGATQGISEDEICQKLGQPSSIAAQVLEAYKESQYSNEAKNYGNKEDIDINFNETIFHVDIDLPVSDVHFTPSPNGHFRVVMKRHHRLKNLDVSVKNGILGVSAKKPFLLLHLPTKNKCEATIYVPTGFAGEIKVKLGAGKISAHGTHGHLNFRTGAGNIAIDECSHGNVTLNTGAGNVDLIAGETQELKINTGAGEIKAKIAKVSGESKISTGAGSIKVTAIDVAENMKISSGMGEIKVHLPRDIHCHIATPKSGMGSVYNEIVGNPNAQHVLKTSTGMGSVQLLAL
ncbi:MAG: DUF1700 domain-containing protein [Defluviitaleaceae bacterium]|nr:DUF1700 domain-containing protein [Defluviitaleaceae bacterium]